MSLGTTVEPSAVDPVPEPDNGLLSDALMAAEHTREVRHAQRAALRGQAERAEAQQEIDRLTRHGESLASAARDLTASYSARCDELGEYHRRRRSAAQPPAQDPEPVPRGHQPVLRGLAAMHGLTDGPA